ncbi:hypothetical protein AUK40_05120 [Candidatus Wirthbacteria bacterium CG2_30_54_11]|uniref:Uncharacterized protein n=1 Tax=Candidatus Wirthbacteria bacterium CG2_30_54_11 TaxID=1817892 RepID=A0A1J5IPN3_9BACT|nr:MAG: hypothetical protein AUK40_05120 [Candidatus Wirthbacteria bacterium CG2_30_54_11]
MPVLLLGMYWGHFLHTHESRPARYRQAFVLGLVFAGIATISTLVCRVTPIAILDPANRWPPSIGFISIGLGFSFGMHLIFSLAPQPRWSKWFWQLLAYFGLDAFDLFTVHIVLLYFYRFIWGRLYADTLTVVLFTLALFVLSVLTSSLHMNNSASLFKKGPFALEPPGRRRFKKRYLLGTAAFISVIFWNLNHDLNIVTYGETIGRDEVIGQSLRQLPIITSTHILEGVFRWYEESYISMLQLSVINEQGWVSLKDGDTLTFRIDHQALVLSGESDADGSDLTLVYYGTDDYESVPYQILDPDTNHTDIMFTLKRRIAPEMADNRYFLYWGTIAPPVHDVPDAAAGSAEGYRIDPGERHSSLLVATLDRTWQLVSLPAGVQKLPLTLTVRVTDPSLVTDAAGAVVTLWYRVEGTDLAGPMIATGDSVYTVEVPADALETGSYSVSAYLFAGERQIQSRSVPFFVSEPVLVAWTMDWEGWDVSDGILRSIENQVNRHDNIPITHFFSPRVFLESVMPPERAEYLVTKVSTWAQKYRHEIQLHLHMQFDMVEAAGVTPRTEPRWGYKSGEGYDVPTTAYTAEEFTKIVQWGEHQFIANGLPSPVGYRAGGWFADESTLSVLDSLGFLYDSSGREQKMWGGSATSPWNLGSTTQPYHPSTADQNKSGPSALGLLEIPNNGADAYGYSGEQMVERFNANFSGEPLTGKKVVTFISHPEWQRTDEPKMDEVLGITDEHLYSAGQGPVIYVTLGQVYALWK